MRNRLIMDKIQKRIVGAVAAEEELKDAIILTKAFGHKTLEERSAEFGGNLNLTENMIGVNQLEEKCGNTIGIKSKRYLRKLNITKVQSRIVKSISTEEVLKDIIPFQYSQEVLTGRSKIILTVDPDFEEERT